MPSPLPTPATAVLACIDTLEALAADPERLASLDRATRNRLVAAAGRLSRPDRHEREAQARAVRRQRSADKRAADQVQLESTGIRKLRAAPVFVTPAPRALELAGGGTFEEPSAAPNRGAGQSHEAKLVQGAALPQGASLPQSNAPPQSSALPQSDSHRLHNARHCYVCKASCHVVHPFYDQMCPECGAFNYAKRQQTADLRGRVALITGARVKIGYQAAIVLLRSGCRVIVTTRFPGDAARRYAREVDHADWAERLEIHGLDLRQTPSVESFAQYLEHRLERLDFVLHNACQTVRRPVGFYRHLMAAEQAPLPTLPRTEQLLLQAQHDWSAWHRGRTDTAITALGAQQVRSGNGQTGQSRQQDSAASLRDRAALSALLSQVPLTAEDSAPGDLIFPAGQLDADLQQVDRRPINSWRLTLDQVDTVELLEVQLVNAIAPFVMNARLRRLMTRERTFDKHIVNVSAMEGQFYRTFKTDKHPHTNMAKAALNMMTRTSAADYAKDGIFMNSVDTGWVTDEDVVDIAERKTRETGFQPPLDIVDGAARIVDPILSGINSGKHVWGQFLKDYRPTAW